MTLHTFAKGLNHSALFRKCLAVAGDSDAILLIEDGVHWAFPSPLANEFIVNPHEFYCLSEDARARGINKFRDGVSLVDYEGFVELTVRFDKTIAWF